MNSEIDLRDRLRFAADSLAADFGDSLTADRAEALVFSSAQGLLATASVTDFVPILAERRARLAVRAGVAERPAATEAVAATPVIQAEPEPAAMVVEAPRPRDTPATEPLLAVPVDDLDRLRDRVDQARVRLSDWRADLAQR